VFSFLFSSTLLFGLLVSWPIYQHFKNARKIIQEVPSLHLFLEDVTKTKQMSLSNFWLLLMRILMILGILILVAFPVFRSDEYYEIPQTNLGEVKQKYIACLIDDSIYSMSFKNGKSRLAYAVSWLSEQVESYPENYRYFFATTSFPLASKYLDKKEFLERIKTLKSTNIKGYGYRAYQSLLEKADVELSSFVILASREEELWKDVQESELKERPILFVDTSEFYPEIYLENVSFAGKNESFQFIECKLAGKPEDLTSRKLLLSVNGEQVLTHKISSFEADELKVRLSLDLSKKYKQEFTISIEGETSQWSQFFYVNDVKESSTQNLLLIHPLGKEYELAAKILKAALVPSLEQATSLRVVSGIESLKVEDLTDKRTIILLGYTGFPISKLAQFNNILAKDSRFLFLPPVDAKRSNSQGIRHVLRWRRRAPSRAGDIAIESDLQGVDLSELEILNIRDFAQGALVSPVFAKNNIAVLSSSRDGILSKSQFTSKSLFVAAAIPLTLENPFIYHPTFPLLLEKLIFPEDEMDMREKIYNGEFVDLRQAFAVDKMKSAVIYPDKSEYKVLDNEPTSNTIEIGAAGFYRSKSDTNSLFAANDRRPMDSGLLTAEEWQQKYHITPHWSSVKEVWKRPDFRVENIPTIMEYDLTVFSLYGFLIFFCLEELSLLIIWWRRRV
jgi:hypothetical protein